MVFQANSMTSGATGFGFEFGDAAVAVHGQVRFLVSHGHVPAGGRLPPAACPSGSDMGPRLDR